MPDTAEIDRLKEVNKTLVEALLAMLAATTGEENDQFQGHSKAYLEMVARPRALAAIAFARDPLPGSTKLAEEG